MWLSKMPLTADRVEACSQHEVLVRLTEARDARILGLVRAEGDVGGKRGKNDQAKAGEGGRRAGGGHEGLKCEMEQ